MDLYRTIPDSIFDQHGTMTMENESHNYKAGVDFFLDKKNVLGVMVNGTFADPSVSNYSRTEISYIPVDTIDRILVADNSSVMKRNNVNLNLNYSYTGADGKSLTLNADYGYYDISTNQLQPNYYYDVNGSNEDLNTDKSNLFVYKENINAGYLNYNRQFKGVMVQAGVRVENTVAKGNSSGIKDNKEWVKEFDRNYTNVFPSAAITFNKNPMNQFGITYSKRIDRPAYQDLNPFEFKLDEYTFQRGNVDLKPQYTNSIGVSHTYKYRLTTSLNYSHVKDMFAQWIDTTEKSKAFISKKNLAQQDIISFNISYPYQYKSYSVFANLSSNYSMYKADFGPGREVDQDAFGLNLYAQNSIKFGKTKTWTAELTGFYVAPTIQQGAFRSESLFSIDAGLAKNLWNNKATIKTSFSDIFNTLQFTGRQEFAGQTTKVNAKWETQQLKLNFVYRFGSNQIKAARNRSTGAEEESKRTQGGSGLGVGQQ